MKTEEQIITLDSLRLYAYHGADPQESIVGAWYTVSVSIKADVIGAVLNDDLSGTVNYAKVTDIIKQQMQIRSSLLEHVAGRIAQAVLTAFAPVRSITVTVCKEHPPVGVPCHTAGFTLTATK